MAQNLALHGFCADLSAVLYLNKNEVFEATLGHWERVAAVTVAVY